MKQDNQQTTHISSNADVNFKSNSWWDSLLNDQQDTLMEKHKHLWLNKGEFKYKVIELIYLKEHPENKDLLTPVSDNKTESKARHLIWWEDLSNPTKEIESNKVGFAKEYTKLTDEEIRKVHCLFYGLPYTPICRPIPQ